MAPFIWGGAEELATNLVRRLSLSGHTAELLRVPFKWDPYERLLEEMLICKSFRLTNVDKVIAMKFPTYLIPHKQKTLWIPHQYRQAYDLFDSGHSNIPNTDRGAEIRRIIRQSDISCFRESERIFGVSKVIAGRMLRYNGINCDVLMPPLNDPERFHAGETGGYIFAGGRVSEGKRQHLLVEAMACTKSGVNLVVGGPPDTREYADRLREMVERRDLVGRIKLDLRFMPREEYAQYINNALAVAYLPLDEDSVGYVTMEAFQARKPVVTTSDSGGLLQIVRDAVSGVVSECDAASLAEGLDRLAVNAQYARSLGDQGFEIWRGLNVNWESTLERLLE
jgi:glycosyltransferase involved in cell wall biosynthesis